MRAERTGVARTGSEPLFTTFAVSFSVTILVAVPFIPMVMDMGILLFIIDID